MKNKLRDEATIVVLLLVLTILLWLEGTPSSALKFSAFVLVTYGSGMLLWSHRALSEWKGWMALAIGVALALYFNSFAVWAYSVMVLSVQVVFAVAVYGWRKWRRKSGEE